MNRLGLMKLGMILACTGLLYAPVIEKLVYDWINLPDFSHGFLIPIISFYFVYAKRKQLANVSVSGQWMGLGLMVSGILLNLIGNLANEYFTTRFSFLVVIGGVILFILGKDFYKILQFPLIFLVFMIPIPSILMDQVSFPMQLFASKVAAKSLDMIGIPVLREGNIIQLANTSLEVAEACSGIRSLMSLLTISVLLAYFGQSRFPKRVLLVVSAFPVAIVANAARVTGTGVLAYYYGNAAAEGFFHGFSSWIIFVVGLICLYVIGTVLSKIKI